MSSSFGAFVHQFGFWSGLKLHAKSKTKGLQTLTVPELKHAVFIRGKTADRAIFREIFVERQYDISVPFDPKLIIDGGANIGLFSCLFATRFPEAKILAVEPQQDNFSLLEKNTRYYAGVELFNAGLWADNSALQIRSGQFNEATYELEKACGGQNAIPGLTIPDLLEKFPDQPVDILKLDIEGAEEALFNPSCRQWLPRVRMIIIELHPGADGPFHREVDPEQFEITQKGENWICLRK